MNILEGRLSLKGDEKIAIIQIQGKELSQSSLKNLLLSLGYSNDKLTPYGTRGTFTTIMNELRDQHGLDFDIIDKCLAHSQTSKTIASYNHAELLKHRRKALQFWADLLGAIC